MDTFIHTESPRIKDPKYPVLPVGGFVDRTLMEMVVVDIGINVTVTAGASLSLECDLRNAGVGPDLSYTWVFNG